MIDIFCQRISNSQKLQGGNTAPPATVRGYAPDGCAMGDGEEREKAGMGEKMA
jgi:hypothetical protein